MSSSADAAKQRLEAMLPRDREAQYGSATPYPLPGCYGGCGKPAAPGKPLCAHCQWLVQHGKKPCPCCGNLYRDFEPGSVDT